MSNSFTLQVKHNQYLKKESRCLPYPPRMLENSLFGLAENSCLAKAALISLASPRTTTSWLPIFSDMIPPKVFHKSKRKRWNCLLILGSMPVRGKPFGPGGYFFSFLIFWAMVIAARMEKKKLRFQKETLEISSAAHVRILDSRAIVKYFCPYARFLSSLRNCYSLLVGLGEKERPQAKD